MMPWWRDYYGFLKSVPYIHFVGIRIEEHFEAKNP